MCLMTQRRLQKCVCIPKRIKGNFVACGKCIECKIAKSREWAFRICDEAKNYKENCFLTLTYNEDNIPVGNTLVKKDLQDFLKRLRRHIDYHYGAKCRFFACGEYGSKGKRPHYHVIIFGYKPKDAYFFRKDNKGSDLFRSPELERLWNKGFSTICQFTYETALYTAIYMQKPPSDDKLKPFIQMSRRPGIGFDSIDSDSLIFDKVYHNGKYIKMPRYYLDVLERDGFGDMIEPLKARRLENCNNSVDVYAKAEKKRKKFIELFPQFFGNVYEKFVSIRLRNVKIKKYFLDYPEKYL